MAWAINMHNHVNKKNGKKIYAVKEAIKAIIDNDDKCIVFKEEVPLYKTTEQFKNNNKIETFNNNSNITIILSISIIINILLLLLIVLRFK
jgi:hypothetical protein